jgi:uncharacterized tellurite resistance protein B-like protein
VESLSLTILVFFVLKLMPQLVGADGTTPTRTRVTDRQLQLATAVLLLEAARCDFDLRADEFNALLSAVRRMMGLTEDEAVAVIRFAEEEVRQSKRLYEFTGLVDANYTPEQKKALVQYLWQVAYADAQLVASEEYLEEGRRPPERPPPISTQDSPATAFARRSSRSRFGSQYRGIVGPAGLVTTRPSFSRETRP